MKVLRMIFISFKKPFKMLLLITAFGGVVLGIFMLLKLLLLLIPGGNTMDARNLNALMYVISFVFAVPIFGWGLNIKRALQIAKEKEIPLEKAWEEVKIEEIRRNGMNPF